MKCPYCQTENRDDQEKCYHCERDLSMLRLIVNKAKHHFNQGLELADRGRNDEAISEMKNALDLDATLVNARVVLGTLYAKQERFEEARRCWDEALEQDHRLAKAHEYLGKADVVEQSLPAIKNLQRMSVLLGVAAAVLLIAVIGLLAAGMGRGSVGGGAPTQGTTTRQAMPSHPGPDETIPVTLTPVTKPAEGSAVDAQLLAQIAEMRKELAATREEAQASRLRATALESQRLDLAVVAMAAGSADVALELVRRVRESGQLDAATAERAEQIERQATESLAAGARAAAEGYVAGATDYATFKRANDAWLRAAGSGPAADEARQLAQRIEAAEGERLLAKANDTIANGALADAIRATAELKSLRPEQADAVAMTLDLRLDAEAAQLTEAVQGLVGEGAFAEAWARIDEMAMAYRSAGREEGIADLDALRRAVGEREATTQLEQARAAYDDKLWEAFLEQAGGIDAAMLGETEKGELEATIARAKSRLAQERWGWFQELDPKFSDGRISEEEAARAAAIYRATIADLPESMAWAKAPILFYAATAHLKLGEAAEAAKRIEEIEAMEKIPDYIRPQVKAFKEKNAEALGG
jgi:tetratricopeptide (TPR) repeat protein